MRNVACIPQHQLQRVRPRRKVQRHFGLTPTEMQVIVIRRDAIGQLIRAISALPQRRTVDQQVMMARVFLFHSSRGNAIPLRPNTTVTGD